MILVKVSYEQSELEEWKGWLIFDAGPLGIHHKKIVLSDAELATSCDYKMSMAYARMKAVREMARDLAYQCFGKKWRKLMGLFWFRIDKSTGLRFV